MTHFSTILSRRALMAGVLATGLLAPIGSALAADTVKIGVIAPLTGPGAPWGVAAAEGPRIAADEINAAGGLDVGGKKLKVEVVAYDDQYKTADAVAAFNRLVNQDGVKFVIILSSAGTMALREAVMDYKVLGFSSAYTRKALDKSNPYMFRLYSTPHDYVPSMVDWLKAHHPSAKRVAIINPNDETGWDQTELGERVFKERGFEVVGKELYERALRDFQPTLTKLIAQKPDVIELGGTPPATAGLIVRQARELGYSGLIFKTGGAGPRDIVAAAGAQASEGLINMLYADPNNAGYKRIAAAYEKRTGHAPNEILVAYYDGAKALLAGIAKAGTTEDTAKVAAALSTALPIESAQGDQLKLGGKAAYGADLQIETVNYIGVIKGGQPVAIAKTK